MLIDRFKRNHRASPWEKQIVSHPLFSRVNLLAALLPLLTLLVGGCSNQAPMPTSTASSDVTTTSADASTRLVNFEFEAPRQLESPSGPVSVESPGYASPCWADINDDGKKDLLVGQFAQGKIQVFKNQGDMQLAEGEWLMAGDEVAEVPGVW